MMHEHWQNLLQFSFLQIEVYHAIQTKRNDSIYILKICCRPFVRLFIFCTVEEEEFESVLFPLRSVYAGTTRGFRDGGEVKYQVCVNVVCC